MSTTLAELAQVLGATLEGDGSLEIHRLNEIQQAGEGEVSFIANPKYRQYAENSNASALIIQNDLELDFPNLLRVANPQAAMIQTLSLLNHKEREINPGIHPTVVIGDDVTVPDSAEIGPYVVIEDGASIGEDVILEAHVTVGRFARVGSGSWMHSNSVLYDHCELGENCNIHSGTVIGSDGYGFFPGPEGIVKIPQTGRVIVGNDVEMGGNCSIDRGTIGDTIIGDGTKLDNLVHIAHNVRIGRNCFITGLVGIAGSSILGDRVQMGGQSGIIGHLKIGNDVSISTRAAVTKDLPDGVTVSGFPAAPHRDELKKDAYIRRLPQLFEQVKRLAKQLNKS